MPGDVDLFVSLFRGRGDAYGSWTGGCVRQPLTRAHFQWHLHSDRESDWIGVYNVIGSACSWGCVDIDTKDLELARNIRTALAVRDVPSWIEQTTRGYHVWVFPEPGLVDASVMKRALTAACRAVQYQPKEVFPKQTSATGTKLGNYVRLPMNGFYSRNHPLARRFLFTGQESLYMMNEYRASVAVLEQLAQLLPPPQVGDITVDLQAGLEVEDVVSRLGGLAYRIWHDGPLPGSDRSTTLVHLAKLAAEGGLTPDETMAIVRSADDRWGKDFISRGEAGVDILTKIVSAAHS